MTRGSANGKRVSVLRRGIQILCVCLLVFPLVYAVNYVITGDHLLTVRLSVFGSLAWWVAFPPAFARLYRDRSDLGPPPGVAVDHPIARWTAVGLGLYLIVASMRWQPWARVIAWEVVAALFSFSAALLAVEQLFKACPREETANDEGLEA
jgi:hypothetical protein